MAMAVSPTITSHVEQMLTYGNGPPAIRSSARSWDGSFSSTRASYA